MVLNREAKHLDRCIERFLAELKRGKRQWKGSEKRIYFDEFQIWFVEKNDIRSHFWRRIEDFGRPTTIRSLEANAGDRGRKELYQSLKGQVKAHKEFLDLLSIRVLKYNRTLCKDYGFFALYRQYKTEIDDTNQSSCRNPSIRQHKFQKNAFGDFGEVDEWTKGYYHTLECLSAREYNTNESKRKGVIPENSLILIKELFKGPDGLIKGWTSEGWIIMANTSKQAMDANEGKAMVYVQQVTVTDSEEESSSISDDGYLGDTNKREKLSFFVELFGFNWKIISDYMDMDEDECLEYFRETKKHFWNDDDAETFSQGMYTWDKQVMLELVSFDEANTGDLDGAIRPSMFEDCPHQVLVSKSEMQYLDHVQKKLRKSAMLFPFCVRAIVWLIIFIWILTCNYLTVVHSVNFNLYNTPYLDHDVQEAWDNAYETCPADDRTVLGTMHFVYAVQYVRQRMIVDKYEKDYRGIWGDIQEEEKWLLSVIITMLSLYWVVIPFWTAIIALNAIYFEKTYIQEDMEGVIESTIKKGTKLKVTLYDLVFQPHRVIEANRRIAIARSKAIERDMQTLTSNPSFHGREYGLMDPAQHDEQTLPGCCRPLTKILNILTCHFVCCCYCYCLRKEQKRMTFVRTRGNLFESEIDTRQSRVYSFGDLSDYPSDYESDAKSSIKATRPRRKARSDINKKGDGYDGSLGDENENQNCCTRCCKRFNKDAMPGQTQMTSNISIRRL